MLLGKQRRDASPQDPEKTPETKRDLAEDLQSEYGELWDGEDGITTHVKWLQSKLKNPDVEEPKSATDIRKFLGDPRKLTKTQKQSHERLGITITGIFTCIDILARNAAGAASNVRALLCFTELPPMLISIDIRACTGLFERTQFRDTVLGQIQGDLRESGRTACKML